MARERRVQACGALRYGGAEPLHRFVQLGGAGHGLPLPFVTIEQRPRGVIEGEDLNLRAGLYLGGQPVHGIHHLAPLGRLEPLLLAHVAAPEDVYDRAIQHAGGGIDEDDHALSAHSQARQVLTIAVACESAQPVALNLWSLGVGQALGLRLQFLPVPRAAAR